MKIKFCNDCGSMLYDIVEEEGKAFQKCLVCPYREEITKSNPVVYEHDLQQDTSVQYSAIPYIKFDQTLPTFKNMICPNDDCPTHGKESNIVGQKLDIANVKWMYQCRACDEKWTQFARGPA